MGLSLPHPPAVSNTPTHPFPRLCRESVRTAAGHDDGVRWDRVARARRMIRAGECDTDDRLDAALDRMIDAIG